MKRPALLLPLLSVLALLTAGSAGGQATGSQAGGGPEPGHQPYAPHLGTLGFDTLGSPSTAYNTEIAVDIARKFAYVGSLEFQPLLGKPPEGDPFVKAVNVSNPTNPTMTDQEPPLGGDLGTWDVTVAGNILAASTQGFPGSNAGVTLMDITNPANPQAVGHVGEAQLQSPFGSHTNYLWRDALTGRTWLVANGLDVKSVMIFEVSDPAHPQFRAEYSNTGAPFGEGYVHDSFVQANGSRVLSYQVGSLGFEIVDITRIVRGGDVGELTNADVVGFNYYSALVTPNLPVAPPVTRPMFAHYAEPTASGRVTWVGDEVGCGEPAIVHSFDTAALPLPPAKKPLPELGVIIENPDAPMCSGPIHGQSSNGQFNDFRWTGHNFDVWGDELLIRGDYGRGVDVYDISDPANAGWVAKSRGLNQMVGDENSTEPGRDKEVEHYPFIWQAVYDGDKIYASDIQQGIYVLDLIEGK